MTLRNPIGMGLLDTIRTRFGDAFIHQTTLVIECVDQASFRALPSLLWDARHEVLSVTNTSRVAE